MNVWNRYYDKLTKYGMCRKRFLSVLRKVNGVFRGVFFSILTQFYTSVIRSELAKKKLSAYFHKAIEMRCYLPDCQLCLILRFTILNDRSFCVMPCSEKKNNKIKKNEKSHKHNQKQPKNIRYENDCAIASSTIKHVQINDVDVNFSKNCSEIFYFIFQSDLNYVQVRCFSATKNYN